MTSIVVAVALAAAAGPEPDRGVVPVGFFPGGGGAWSGTTTYQGFGREATYPGIGPEYYNRPPGFGRDGRRYDAPYSPSPYDNAPARRVNGTIGVGVGVGGGGYGGGFGAPGYGGTGVRVGVYSGTSIGSGGGLFRRR